MTIIGPPSAGDSDTADMLVLVCRAIRQETPDAKSYVFGLEDGGLLSFLPGQFMTFTFETADGSLTRSYSLSSSAANGRRVAITVKRVSGGVASNWLFDNLRVGARVTAVAPGGAFTAAERSDPLLLLSAGSGITPFASVMRHHADLAQDADIVFLHFARSGEDMIFRDEFAHWARAMPRARVMAVATQPTPGSGWVGPTGRLNEALLTALVPDIQDRTVFCCGPDGFMRLARGIAAKTGVPDARFHEESFGGPGTEAAVTGEASASTTYAVHFSKSDLAATCGAGTTILKAAQSVKVNIQSSCTQGLCGTCRVKLVSGTVDMNHKGGIKQREIDRGFILACCSRPTSDLVIER